MILSNDQINELSDIVNLNHIVFLAQNVGTEVLSDLDMHLLSTYGIDVEKLAENSLFDAYSFGALSSNLDQEQLENLDYDKYKKFTQSIKYKPLTDTELETFKSVQRQAYKDIKGLGNRIDADMQQVIIEVDKTKRADYEKLIQSEAELNVLNRGTVKDLVSNLGHKTGDWGRDFGRISDFLMHTSFSEGQANSIKKQDGDDAIIYKSVYTGACKHCRKLYLTDANNINSEPKHFKVGEILANGTNIGIKAIDWKPVIASTHPFCRCLVHKYIQGYKWNENTRQYDIKLPYERKVKRKSKIRYKVGEGEWKEI